MNSQQLVARYRRLRGDPGVRAAFDCLEAAGASKAALIQLSADLAALPDRFTEVTRETKKERSRRLHALASKTRRLANEYGIDSDAKVLRLSPRVGRLNLDFFDSPNSMLLGGFLKSLVDEIDRLAGVTRTWSPLGRRMSLEAFVAIGCIDRLLRTGMFRRRPLAYAATFASATLHKTITAEDVKKYLDRASRAPHR